MRAQELQYRFKQRNTKTQERVREQMANANREVWVCDPDDPHATGTKIIFTYSNCDVCDANRSIFD